jgi:hypothetical protein
VTGADGVNETSASIGRFHMPEKDKERNAKRRKTSVQLDSDDTDRNVI